LNAIATISVTDTVGKGTKRHHRISNAVARKPSSKNSGRGLDLRQRLNIARRKREGAGLARMKGVSRGNTCKIGSSGERAKERKKRKRIHRFKRGVGRRAQGNEKKRGEGVQCLRGQGTGGARETGREKRNILGVGSQAGGKKGEITMPESGRGPGEGLFGVRSFLTGPLQIRRRKGLSYLRLHERETRLRGQDVRRGGEEKKEKIQSQSSTRMGAGQGLKKLGENS